MRSAEADIDQNFPVAQSGPAGDWCVVDTLWVHIYYYWHPCYILQQLSWFIPKRAEPQI